MRTLVLVLAAAVLCSGPAIAQTTPAAKASPTGGGATRPAVKAKYTLETPIHDLMEDSKMLAWLDRHFPGLSERMRDPEVGTMFAGVSIHGLSIDPDHGRALTPEVMAKLAISLEKAQAEPSLP
jgi:hypothetical protein